MVPGLTDATSTTLAEVAAESLPAAASAFGSALGSAFAIAAFSGTASFAPTRRLVGSTPGFACSIAATVVPYFFAILPSVSPETTSWTLGSAFTGSGGGSVAAAPCAAGGNALGAIAEPGRDLSSAVADMAAGSVGCCGAGMITVVRGSFTLAAGVLASFTPEESGLSVHV